MRPRDHAARRIPETDAADPRGRVRCALPRSVGGQTNVLRRNGPVEFEKAPADAQEENAMRIRSQRYVAAWLALLVMTGGACGRKTAPLVPDSPRPEAVKSVKAETRDTVAFLSWAIPTLNVEGKNMAPADIQRFRISRAELGHDR